MIPRLLLQAMLLMDQVSLNVGLVSLSWDLKTNPRFDSDRLRYSFKR